jgi:hypothetical protein
MQPLSRLKYKSSDLEHNNNQWLNVTILELTSTNLHYYSTRLMIVFPVKCNNP